MAAAAADVAAPLLLPLVAPPVVCPLPVIVALPAADDEALALPRKAWRSMSIVRDCEAYRPW